MLKSKCSDAVSKFDANSRQISNTNCPTVTLIPKFAIFLLQFSDHFENSNTLTCCLPFTRKKMTSAQFCSTGKHFLEGRGDALAFWDWGMEERVNEYPPGVLL